MRGRHIGLKREFGWDREGDVSGNVGPRVGKGVLLGMRV